MSKITVYFEDINFFYIDKEIFEKKSSLRCFNNEFHIPVQLDELITLTHSIVHCFIDYINNDRFTMITTSNVVALGMLADMFKVHLLKKFTDNFIELHSIEIIQNYFSKFNGKCNSEYENLIASQLNHFLDEPKLLDMPIIHLQAILRSFMKNNSLNRNILDFIFKYIETQKSGIFLLRLIPVIEEEEYFLKQIFERTDFKKSLALLEISHIVYLYKKIIEYKELINSIKFYLTNS